MPGPSGSNLSQTTLTVCPLCKTRCRIPTASECEAILSEDEIRAREILRLADQRFSVGRKPVEAISGCNETCCVTNRDDGTTLDVAISLSGLPTSLIDAIGNIVKMFQRKNADYVDGGVWYENFQIEEATGLSAQDAVEALIAVKTGRLKTLRAKAKRGSGEAINEPALDTYEDRAVYALISYAMYLEGER